MITLHPNFGLISMSNNGILRVLWYCYGNIHPDSHTLKIQKCCTKYFRLKCINNKYL